MRVRLAFGMAAALMVLATAAFAYPNLSATTGLIGLPNANIAPAGSLVGAADVLFFDDSIVNARAVLGLSSRWEAGAGAVIGDDNGLILNAKYQLAPRPAGFTWATGLSYLTTDDSGNGFNFYFVGTRPFTQAAPEGTQLVGSLGVSLTDVDDASFIRPFVGGQLQFGPRSELGAEFQLEIEDISTSISSLYYRHTFSPNFAGQLGVTNANGFVGQDDHNFFVGASLGFAGTGRVR